MGFTTTCFVKKCNRKKELYPRVIDGATYWFCKEHKVYADRPNLLAD